MFEDQIVFWMGGSACAGKSTLARMYAEKYGLDLYVCDEHFDDHLIDILSHEFPAMYKVSKMSPNEAFYTRGIQEQLEVYVQSLNEDFSFVLRDLAARHNRPIIIEGNQLLPHLVAPNLKKLHKAIWIVPTESFQREQYCKRNWIKGILEKTESPTIAFDNWMSRDALFAKLVYKEAKNLGFHVLQVDGNKNLQQNFELIERVFVLNN